MFGTRTSIHPASSIEIPLVKSLYPIHEIAERLSQADSERVRLKHAADEADVNEVASPADATAATIRALAEPVEFPPLAAGLVPGDHVAIAVDSEVPCLVGVLRGAIKAFEQAGVDRPDISVVTTDVQTRDLCRDALENGEAGPQVVVHDPHDQNNLCLVGMTKRGEPLLVNRAIFDADVVLPIGCARVGRENAYDSLFPQFSNAEALEKYRTPSQHEALTNRNAKRNEVDEAGWMIGAPMTVQVVPGRGETAANIVAGEPKAVARRMKELCRVQWLLRSPQRVSLLIATVTGGSRAQTWANVGRALASAERLLIDGGAVAICSNLDEQPGPSLGRLIGSPDLDVAARKISHDHSADSWPAWYLARRCSVDRYIFSAS